ncbi:ferritin-like domain-containing protein [Lentzea sp. NPDC051838]|uniref:ferritin-like domain-containing protein n=1 Tax=Lentzea sp. NPDC051838 TaxID=3154849 RepID=UPI0034380669
MSVFDLPRLHFAGVALTRLPTGPRNGLVDFTTHTALMDGKPFPRDRPAAEYHAYLESIGAKGETFGANGTFNFDAGITGVEIVAGDVQTDDLVVGRAVDVWGHYNEYLATTFNRARIFDVDPASTTSTTVMIGQFGFGRLGRSHDVEYMFSGGVHGMQPPRWQQDGRVLYQFVVPAGEEMTWLDSAASSPAVDRLRSVAADGLVVQYAMADPGPAPMPGTMAWQLRGTIAPWHADEPRTFPAGRVLGDLTVELRDGAATFNRFAPAADLQLCTESGVVLATVPGDVGITTVPCPATDEALCLTGAEGVVAREQEVVVVVDDASLILEHPRDAGDSSQDVEVEVRTFVRGVPAAADVHIRQIHNPRAFPLDQREHIDVVRLSTDAISTDEHGRGTFVVRGAEAGATRLEFSPGGSMTVRVLPNHWWMDDVPQDEVTFDLLYREVFSFYELMYSFMADEVFSLADKFRIDTYYQITWNMCDPRNRMKTYYMPQTRDLTGPQARLMLKYLRARRAEVAVPTIELSAPRSSRPITTRAELIRALKHGVTIELAVMLQYLYAAYSVPTYGAGEELVRRGDWTPEQLTLMCGDGGETREGGLRASLMDVAREEMIHFLVINNVLMATGEPFYVPDIDFGTLNETLPVPLDFSLEALNLGSVQRFIQIEQPEGLVGAVRLGDLPAPSSSDGHEYASLSELYGDIREGLQRVPDLFLVDKGRGGGEHRLFMRESVNAKHPDYVLEVDDLRSALFAIDFVTEQGEGHVLTEDSAEDSHYDTFVRISELLMKERLTATEKGRAQWNPAYPVARNPTLHEGQRSKELVTDPVARDLTALFNGSYYMVLQLMVQHFGNPDASLRRSKFMNTAIDVMTGVMRPLGELLVAVPSGRHGRTAGPSFELDEQPAFIPRPDVAQRALSMRFQNLLDAARKCPLVPEKVIGNLAHFSEQQFSNG